MLPQKTLLQSTNRKCVLIYVYMAYFQKRFEARHKDIYSTLRWKENINEETRRKIKAIVRKKIKILMLNVGHKLALSILAVSTKRSIILLTTYKNNNNNNLLKQTLLSNTFFLLGFVTTFL